MEVSEVGRRSSANVNVTGIDLSGVDGFDGSIEQRKDGLLLLIGHFQDLDRNGLADLRLGLCGGDGGGAVDVHEGPFQRRRTERFIGDVAPDRE